MEAVVSCSSSSGRTQLYLEDMDLEGNFQSGYFIIDGEKLTYGSKANATIVSHLDQGVYTVSIFENRSASIGFIFLEYYALPKTIKSIDYKKGTKYTFQGIIDESSTDPRTKKRLNKTILLECSAIYNWKEI